MRVNAKDIKSDSPLPAAHFEPVYYKYTYYIISAQAEC